MGVLIILLVVLMVCAICLLRGSWYLQNADRSSAVQRKAQVRWEQQRADFRMQQLTQQALRQMLREARTAASTQQPPIDGDWYRP